MKPGCGSKIIKMDIYFHFIKLCNFWTKEMYGYLTVGYANVREVIVKYVKVGYANVRVWNYRARKHRYLTLAK